MAKPDVAFEYIKTMKSGFSTPVFLLKHNDVYYMTKVVWPYDPALATGKQDMLDAIDELGVIFDKTPDSGLTAREVSEDDVGNIIASHAK